MTRTAPRPYVAADEPEDVRRFVQECVRGGGTLPEVPADFFGDEAPVFVARAPGRLDVMGGIADYSGSLVLQMPIAKACLVAAQAVDGGEVRILSVGIDGAEAREACIPAADLRCLCRIPYEEVRAFFRSDPDRAWSAYVAGVLVVLSREEGMPLEGGWNLLVRSQVPEGKGVSSSAALEVATMQAVCAASGTPLDGETLAHRCQQVENRVVGAPCGIMDQMTSALGRTHQLLRLLCQPAVVEGFVPLPAGLRVWGVDSGLRHAVSGSDYTDVRTGAFMGLHLLQQETGADWGGHLANVDPEAFADLEARLPERMGGAAFLERYGPTPDPVTQVHPDRDYAVRQPTAHPVHEHARVRRFAALLDAEPTPEVRQELGRLMGESHRSYSACGLGSDGTDLLAELVREAGPRKGLYGARITGGGCGGTVAILGDAEAGEAVRAIARDYTARTGRVAQVFQGSSAGACAFGAVRLRTGPSR